MSVSKLTRRELLQAAAAAPLLAANAPLVPYGAVPSARQLAWSTLEYYNFLHFTVNTFTDREWGNGDENPAIFNPTHFDADAICEALKASGSKGVILTCKHHDGFCLWDTKLTDYNIMNTPFKRDVVKELSDACKRQGIAFGAYYSVCDWHNPDFPLTSPGGKVKRDKSDLDAYNQYLLGQIKELITNYGPLITIWNDVPQLFHGRGNKTIELVRTLQPDILINNRTGDGGDYETPEQKIGKFNNTHPWESCMTISAHNAWAWGGDGDGVKPVATVIHMLASCAGGDGNMLLNVGPQPDGQINAAQAGRLREIGQWMDKNGESIYGTRGGPWKPSKTITSTRKGNTIYVHILDWPTDTVTLPALGKHIIASTLLSGGDVKVIQSADDQPIKISVDPKDRQEMDTIVKLTIDGSAMEIDPMDVP